MAYLSSTLRNVIHFWIHAPRKSSSVLRQVSACRLSYCTVVRNYVKAKTIICHSHETRMFLLHRRCIHNCESQSAGDRYSKSVDKPDPELDWSYLCDENNLEEIQQNVKNRKGIGDITKVQELYKELKALQETPRESKKASQIFKLQKELLTAALAIPNKTHKHSPIGDESVAHVLDVVGREYMDTDTTFKKKTVIAIGEQLDALRVRNLTLATGTKSYFFKGPFARLQTALTRYTLDVLLNRGFRLLSVPDIVHSSLIEACGFPVEGERDQVYKIDSAAISTLCLAGTGEIPIAGYCMNRVFNMDELPLKFVTVSRCFRAETSTVDEEQGIYRVHQFNKVEMFGVTSQETGTESDELMQELMDLQKELFSPLGFCFRVLNMPTHELGSPAYRKVDMEAWMPGKSFWGEISSTTNCIDYQARRFLMKYPDENGSLKFCHTVNGTACAVPRMIMAIVEANQLQDGTVAVPAALRKYMNQELLENTQPPVVLKPIKYTRSHRKH